MSKVRMLWTQGSDDIVRVPSFRDRPSIWLGKHLELYMYVVLSSEVFHNLGCVNSLQAVNLSLSVENHAT